MIAGLSSTLPTTLTSGLVRHGVPQNLAQHIGSLPPVSSLFAAVLGVNPLHHLLAASGELARLPQASQQLLTGRAFFPHLISGPFDHGLAVVFGVAAALAGLAAVASLLRGGRYTAANVPASQGQPTAEPVPAQRTSSNDGERPGAGD
jgi:hypothetical protein